ncbi:MAG: hypothetical protein EBY17_27195 [Acidobacteriia bacterium]|nr:hypothetical protein [Terriglobia bacterium]
MTDDEGRCQNCSDYLKHRVHLRKQRLVKAWLDGHDRLRSYEYYDRPVEGGICGKERPDFVWDTPTHKVVLEVDEHQHQTYTPECEKARMEKVTYSLGLPCLWVRFNPDEFQGPRSSTIKERERRDLLLRVLEDALRDVPTQESEVVRVRYLFYDGFRLGQPVSTEVLPVTWTSLMNL